MKSAPHTLSHAQCQPSHLARWRPLLILCASACFVTAAGCEPQGRPPGRALTPRTIVLVGDGENTPLHPLLIGAAAAFRAQRPDVEVRVVAPSVTSPVRQQQLLSELGSAKYDALCIVPIDGPAIGPMIDRIARAGRPVVTAIRDAPHSQRAAYCGADEAALGRMAAIAASRIMHGRADSVLLLRSAADDPVFRTRYATVVSELTKSGGADLMDEVDCGGDPNQALMLVRQTSRKYPRVGAWIFLDDWPLRILEPRERILPLGCGLIICADSPEHFPRVRSGEIQALITTDLHEVLLRALEVAWLLAEGEREDRLRSNPNPVDVITYDDIDWHEARWAAWRRGKASPPRPEPARKSPEIENRLNPELP